MSAATAERPGVAEDGQVPGVDRPYTDEEMAEVIRLGNEIFERDVRPTLPPDPPNDYIVIAVDEDDWEINADPVVCHDRMNARSRGRLFARRLVTPYTSRRR